MGSIVITILYGVIQHAYASADLSVAASGIYITPKCSVLYAVYYSVLRELIASPLLMRRVTLFYAMAREV